MTINKFHSRVIDLFQLSHVTNLALSPVGTIHLLSSTVIHRLLLFLELTNALTNRHAVRYGARHILTLARVNLKQSPDSLAHVATTSRLDLTLGSVFQKTLHLGAIGRRALGRGTRGGVEK